MNRWIALCLLAVSFAADAQTANNSFCGIYMQPSDPDKYTIQMERLIGKEIVGGKYLALDLSFEQMIAKVQSICPKPFSKEVFGECYIEELTKLDGTPGFGVMQIVPIRKDENLGSRWFRAWRPTKVGAELVVKDLQKIGICPLK